MDLIIEDTKGKLFCNNTKLLIIIQENHISDKPPEFHIEQLQLEDNIKGYLKLEVK